MLDADHSVKAARRALRVFLPQEDFVLASLKDPTKLYDTWVFRCKVRGSNSAFICKLSTTDAAGRAKILNQYERLKTVHADLKTPLLTTPQPLAYVEKECALIMEHVKADPLQHLLPRFPTPADVIPHLRNAGRWLASFQQTTQKPTAFDPAPHMNWLLKKLTRHTEKLIEIPDHEAFMLDFAQLERRASEAQGLPSMRCVTHRDFHLGNLLFARKGKVYGIDFENQKQDDALRDVMSLLFDLAIKWPARDMPISAFQPAAAALWHGYDDAVTAPAVCAFFQSFAALNGWSGLEARSLSDPHKRHRLARLQQLAKNSLLNIAR